MSYQSETRQILDEGFGEIIKRYPPAETVSSDDGIDVPQPELTMTDILLQVNTDTGQFSILNDDEEEIYSSIVEEWIDGGDADEDGAPADTGTDDNGNSADDYEPDEDDDADSSSHSEILKKAARTLKKYIRAHRRQLDNLSLLKPYSFLLVDDDKETVEELYLVDDKMIVVDSGSLMKGLDKDLDDFYKKLMKE